MDSDTVKDKEEYMRWESEEALNNFKSPVSKVDKESSMKSRVPTWSSARYGLAYLAFVGFFNVYALRVNLSVAIISMINSTETTNTSNECGHTPKNSSHSQGEFNWTSSEKGLILASFFYGYICTQIIGGILAGRYGGKLLFGGGVLCTTVFTLLTPIAARTSFNLLIATRVIEGLGEGVTFPAMHAMWGVWCPPLERSKLVSMTYAGAHFGTVIAQPISGILCASSFLGGWPAVFYVFGTVSLIWCVFWFALAYNKPANHPRISQVELDYIVSNVPQEEQSLSKVPWFDIFTSPRVWAIACAHFANNWGFYTLLTCLPLYLKNVLGFDIMQNGTIAALPYFIMWIMINVSGFIADNLRERGVLTTTQTRKLFNGMGFAGPAVFLVAAGYAGCNNTLAIACICMATAFNACTFSGFNANHIDIASRYAGILMGITNTVATIPGFVSPLVVQAITGKHETHAEWRLVFFISAGVYVFGIIAYSVFATGEEQSWNTPKYIVLKDEAVNSLLSKESNIIEDARNFNENSNEWRHRSRPAISNDFGEASS